MSENPNNKVRGANMEPIWGRQDPYGPHIGPMNFAIWEALLVKGAPVDDKVSVGMCDSGVLLSTNSTEC